MKKGNKMSLISTLVSELLYETVNCAIKTANLVTTQPYINKNTRKWLQEIYEFYNLINYI